MGPVIYSWDKTYITKDDLNQLRSELKNYSGENSLSLRITPAEGCTTQMIFLKWLTPEMAEKLRLTAIDESSSADKAEQPKDKNEE